MKESLKRGPMPDAPLASTPYSLLLYGQPKIGLTELAGRFPAPIAFFNLKDDPSRIKAECFQIPDWPTFLIKAGEVSSRRDQFRTIIVGHVEDMWSQICDFVTRSSNQKNGSAAQNLSELSYADWRQALQILEEKLAKLLTMGNVVLLSHELAEARNIRGNERTHFLINLEKKAQLVVLNSVQAIGRLYICEQDLRLLSFIPVEHQVSGSRLPELLDRKFIIRTGEQPEFIELLNQRPQMAKSA